MAPRSTENRSKTCDNADSSWPCLLVVGLDTTGVEASLALSDAGHCSLTLGDDRCATPDWRSMVSCLIRGVGSPAAAQTSGATTRSQVMANILSSLGRRAVQALSPVGDASVVERFAAMILADPTLPQAMAYNEHCRAVGCGFIFTESRGPVGRLFLDLSGNSGSLREALLNPRFTADLDDTTCVHMRPTSFSDWPEAVAERRACDAGVQDSSGTSRRARRPGGTQQRSDSAVDAAAVAPVGMSDRRLQLHICLQALHVFTQEHGHLPLAFDRDHAQEVVRIAKELVETERNASVPKGFAPETDLLDEQICLRLAALARISVPAVDFLLGGLAASEIHHWATSTCHPKGDIECSPLEGPRDGSSSDKCLPLDNPGTGSSEPNQNDGQWFIIDELDIACNGNCGETSAADGRWIFGATRTGTALDAGALKAWLSPVTGHKIQDARVAIIGCNRLGREVARCLANSGVCSGPSGRVIFIDGGDTLRTGTGCGAWSRNSDIAGVERGAAEIMPGRAAVLRHHMSGAGPGLLPRTFSFDGPVQETNEDFDLWEGIDTAVVCVGQKARWAGRSSVAGECESLLRFVCHKCVLHRKPLVWGWADDGKAGSGGLEVMAPGRTSCLVCRGHGGFKELLDRRIAITTPKCSTETETTPSTLCPAQRQSAVIDGSGRTHSYDRDFGIARSAVAGLIMIELFKLLGTTPSRTDLCNWSLSGPRQEDGPSRGENEDRCRGNTRRGILPLWSAPDPPKAVVSRDFDPLSGDSVRAVPEGFTEWGIEEIRPWKEKLGPNSTIRSSTHTSGSESSDCQMAGGAGDPSITLRTLGRIVFARFGLEITSVAVAAPGSECAGSATGGWGRDFSGEPKLLWAEWEREKRGERHSSDGGKGPLPKMDQSVKDLWKRAMKEPNCGSNAVRLDKGTREPRFIFLDIRGMIGRGDAVLPLFKYWVR